MSFEKILQFWTIYNRQIIEFVFVFTFLLILFVIYRQFFAKSESHAGGDHHANPVSIDTSEIEEKLKKILENQGNVRAAKSESATTAAPAAAGHLEVAAPNGNSGSAEEVQKLKTELKEKEKALEEMKKSAGSGPAVASSSEELKKFEEKIKELEGRLQEYEIISEDIADLSFYKEENARLQKELGASKTGGAPAVTTEPAILAVAPASAAVLAPEPAAHTVTIISGAATVADSSVMTVAGEPKKVESSAPADKVVDDDILKEFAAAVEGQKAAEATPSPAAEEIDPQKLTESKELMGEFENFIKKG